MSRLPMGIENRDIGEAGNYHLHRLEIRTSPQTASNLQLSRALNLSLNLNLSSDRLQPLTSSLQRSHRRSTSASTLTSLFASNLQPHTSSCLYPSNALPPSSAKLFIHNSTFLIQHSNSAPSTQHSQLLSLNLPNRLQPRTSNLPHSPRRCIFSAYVGQ